MDYLLTKAFTAGGDVAAHRIVKHGDADAKVIQAAAAGDATIGIAGELGAETGARIDVHLAGIAPVEAGDAVSRGAPVTADSDGKAVAAARHSHSENAADDYTANAVTGAAAAVRTIGVALSAAGAGGDLIRVLIHPGLA